MGGSGRYPNGVMGCRDRYPKPPNSPKKSCACASDVNASAANIAIPQNPNLPDRMLFSGSCLWVRRGSQRFTASAGRSTRRARRRRKAPGTEGTAAPSQNHNPRCIRVRVCFFCGECCAINSTRVAHRAFRLSQQAPRPLNSSDPLSGPRIAHVDTSEVKLSVSVAEPFADLAG